jgi:uncharacterized protein YbaR (Trm112 family)
MRTRTKRLAAVAGSGVGLVSELAGVLREARLHRPAPPAEGLVLEVGGGQAPFPRADVVVDKYVVDDFERSGEAGLALDRPLVVADGEALPFADGAFSYSLASHVPEHAVDPVRFASELMRVSSAGFVQVPSRESELVYGWPYHPWLISVRGKTLSFQPKPEAAPPGGQIMHEAWRDSRLLRLAWMADRSRWHHSVRWTGRLDVGVTGERRFHETADVDLERTVAALEARAASGDLAPLTERVRDVLRCPVCASSLAWSDREVTCRRGHTYRVAGGVPILLAEAANVAVDRPEGRAAVADAAT